MLLLKKYIIFKIKLPVADEDLSNVALLLNPSNKLTFHSILKTSINEKH